MRVPFACCSARWVLAAASDPFTKSNPRCSMAPRYRAEVDEITGVPMCPKKYKLRPLDAAEQETARATPPPQQQLGATSPKTPTPPPAAAPPSPALAAAPPLVPTPPPTQPPCNRGPARSAMKGTRRGSRDSDDGSQEAMSPQLTPSPPPPTTPQSPPAAPAPQLSSPAAAPPESGGGLEFEGSKRSSLPSKSCLRGKASIPGTRGFSASFGDIGAFLKVAEADSENLENFGEDPKADQAAYVTPAERRSQFKRRSTGRGSIWDDPLGHSTRSVLSRVYRYCGQLVLWEKLNDGREHQNKMIHVQLKEISSQDIREYPKGEDDLEDGTLAALKSNGATRRSDDKSMLRRPSRVSLDSGHNADVFAFDKGATPSCSSDGKPPAAQMAESTPGTNPLRDVLTTKKLDMAKVRAVVSALDDAERWIHEPLGTDPKPIPSALFHAVALGHAELVSLVLEFKADVNKKHDGKGMYMGTIRPGTTAIQCVRARKGRFVGTMLGDRLELIEGLLFRAENAQKEAAPAPAVVSDRQQQAQTNKKEENLAVPATEREMKKSVSMSGARGTMTHTHGHPIMRYDVDEDQHGTCLTARHRDAQHPVVIKLKAKTASSGSETEECRIWEEVSFLRRLAHQNVIMLHETFEDCNHVYLILEHCMGGALFDRLVDDAGKITEPEAQNMSRHLVNGITYLHSCGVCHRDIQPCNVLLADRKRLSKVVVKLIDFSTAKDFGAGCAPMKTKICTPSYVAPEILAEDEAPYTEKVDVWSLGVVVYILLSGMPPFHGSTDVDILKKVRRGILKFRPEERWKAVSEEAKDVLQRTICKSPEERLTAEACGKHPWFSAPAAEEA